VRTNILVVDDDENIRELLGDVLTEEGYIVTKASNGEEAIAKVKEENPYLLLLDVKMPGMDGVEVLRRVREINKSMGVIMITACEDIEAAKDALKLGAFDYIRKPFDLNYLKTSVLSNIFPMT